MSERRAAERVTLERSFRASVEEVWDLWTTKEGIEAWWGPDGFAVTVRALDLRPGGELRYAMRAVAPDTQAFLRQHGMPTASEHLVRYTEIVPRRRLAYLHLVDFVPGVPRYELAHAVELHPAGDRVRMTVSFARMHDEEWTRRAVMGWESELGRLERRLGGAGAAGARP